MLVVLLGMIGIIGPYGTVSLAGGHVTRRERNVAATAEWAAEVELQPELAHRKVGAQLGPVLDPLGLAFDPQGQSRDYNVGQTTLFEETQQFVVEETGIGSDKTDCLALSPQR